MKMMVLRVKNVRRLLGVTQEELAEKTGLSQSYISELENNNPRNNPTIKIIEIIAIALDVCPLTLLSCECDKH